LRLILEAGHAKAGKGKGQGNIFSLPDSFLGSATRGKGNK